MIKISEIFAGIQGEGRWVGQPSVFIRVFGCNLTCSGFGLPLGETTTEIDTIDPKGYERFEDLPLVRTGCDSYASWHPKFKNFSPVLKSSEIEERVRALLSEHKSLYPGGGREWHIVLTGGEPLLNWQRAYPELLERFPDVRNITFETNGTQEIGDALIDYLNDRGDIHITFSVSPKLSASGEEWEMAIQPDCIARMSLVNNSHIYTKFVVDGTRDNHDEVERAVAALGRNDGVYLMPVGGCYEEYIAMSGKVYDFCLANGYRYSPRLHIDVKRNAWGV